MPAPRKSERHCPFPLPLSHVQRSRPESFLIQKKIEWKRLQVNRGPPKTEEAVRLSGDCGPVFGVSTSVFGLWTSAFGDCAWGARDAAGVVFSFPDVCAVAIKLTPTAKAASRQDARRALQADFSFRPHYQRFQQTSLPWPLDERPAPRNVRYIRLKFHTATVPTG